MKKKDKKKKPAAKQKSAKKTTSSAVVGNPTTRKVLHFQYGETAGASGLHKRFEGPEWEETRLNNSATSKPDIVAHPTNLKDIEKESFDAVWSPQSLKHLYSHEVMIALKEFKRILKTDGLFFMHTTDIQRVAEAITKKGLVEPLYRSKVGTVTALDLMYGFWQDLENGNISTVPRTGFTARSLAMIMRQSGFLDITVQRDKFNLWAVGYKRAKKTEQNYRVKVIEENINEMMKQRDELNQAPTIWDESIKI